MADHRDDFADDERQPSLFDVLAQPSTRPGAVEPEGGRVVEFPRRREVPAADGPESGAEPSSLTPPSEAAAAPSPAAAGPATDEAVVEPPTDYLEPAPAVAPEDEWLSEIAPDIDEAERSMLAPVDAPEHAPHTQVAGAPPRTPRAAGTLLAEPTLDDMMSRVWEGLVMRLPAACPVCAGEVLPAPPGTHGSSCTSCGTTID